MMLLDLDKSVFNYHILFKEHILIIELNNLCYIFEGNNAKILIQKLLLNKINLN